MTKLTTALALAASLVAPAAMAAQQLVIDDDGFHYRDAPAQLSYVIDINDDGFTQQPRAEAASPELAFATSECTQLELDAGMTGADCGSMSRSDLARTFIDMND